jgi:hypothetical protein
MGSCQYGGSTVETPCHFGTRLIPYYRVVTVAPGTTYLVKYVLAFGNVLSLSRIRPKNVLPRRKRNILTNVLTSTIRINQKHESSLLPRSRHVAATFPIPFIHRIPLTVYPPITIHPQIPSRHYIHTMKHYEIICTTVIDQWLNSVLSNIPCTINASS